MSKATTTPADDDDALDGIRQEREGVEQIAEREDRMGAIARYLLAVADGEQPDDYDANLAGLPELGGSEQ